MTFYREVNAAQEPFPGMHPDGKRVMFQFNIAAAKETSDTLEEELAKRIADNTTFTRNVDIFIGPKAVVPTGDGPYLLISLTGGVGPDWIHNSNAPNIKNPSIQITVVALDYDVAKVAAHRAYDTLLLVRNVELSPS